MNHASRTLYSLIGTLIISLCLTANAHARNFKIATIFPDGSSWMKTMRASAAEIKKATDGRVKFKFYPGGVMGNDEAVLRKMRIGQLQGASLSSGTLAKFYSDNQVYNLVFKFRDFAEVDHVRKKMDETIINGLKEAGFTTFGIAEGGFAYVMAKQPITTLEQLRQQKFWIPENDPVALAAVSAFGIDPIPLPVGDVLPALQTGVVNAVAAPPLGVLTLQWHTQLQYITDLPLLYIYALLAIDNKAFNKIKPEDQVVVRQILSKAFAEIDRYNREDNIKAFDALKNQGLQLVRPAGDNLDTLYGVAGKAEKSMMDKGDLSQSIVNTINDYLSEVRSPNSDE